MKIYSINRDNYGNHQHILNRVLNNSNLLGVFSDNCIHCQNMKPEWDKLKHRFNNDNSKAGMVELNSDILDKVNNSNIKRKINGFPTIMIIKKGKPYKEYNGNRSSDDMYNFCKLHLTEKKSKKSKKGKKSKRRKSKRGKKSIVNKKNKTIKKLKLKLKGG